MVRQQSKQVTEALAEELHDRGIPFRNEQDSQDLAAEPAAALIFNFMWVVAGGRNPEAYAELVRVASRASASEEAARQFDSQLKRVLRGARARVRMPLVRGRGPRCLAASHHRIPGRRDAPSAQRLVAGIPTRHTT